VSTKTLATQRSAMGIPTGRLAIWWVLVSEVVIFELWKRDTDRRVAEFMRGLESRLVEIDEDLRGRVAARRQVA